MNLLADIQTGLVEAIKAAPDLDSLQIVTADSDEVKETASAFVGVEIARELVAGSRIFIVDGTLLLRVNRSAYTAEESATIRQNLVAALLNSVADGDWDSLSYGSAKVLGFVMGTQNTTFADEVQLDSFLFKLWAYQLEL